MTELVGVPVVVPLLVMLDETLEVLEILEVWLALAPDVTEGVAVLDNDALRLDVDDGVSDAAPVPDALPDSVLDGEGVRDDVGVPLAEAPAERVVVGDAETVVERLNVVDPLSLPDGV